MAVSEAGGRRQREMLEQIYSLWRDGGGWLDGLGDRMDILP